MFGLVLFAQGVVAANACDVLRGNVAQAFTVKTDAAAMPCHDEAAANANACLAHCTQGDQVSVDQVTPVFLAPASATLTLDAPASSAAARPAYFCSRVALNTGPPVSIRFCSFQI